MPSPQQNDDQQSHMRVSAGWVAFVLFDPEWMEHTSKGRMVGSALDCEAGEVIIGAHLGTGKLDHSAVVWGRIYICGSPAGRADCVPFTPEAEKRERWADMVHGTWIVVRKANHHTLKHELQVVQTHDIIASWPAALSWNEVRNEIQKAKFTLFREE